MFSRILNFLLSQSKHRKQKPRHEAEPQVQVPLSLGTILHEFHDCTDLSRRSLPLLQADLIYFDHLIDKVSFERDVLRPMESITAEKLNYVLLQSNFRKVEDAKAVVRGILEGFVAVFVPQGVYMVLAFGPEARPIESSQTESVIIGPHDAFVESLNTNLSIIRRKIKSNRLKVLHFEIGEVFKTSVSVLYIDGLANSEFVNCMTERIRNIEYSGIFDGAMLVQMIDDYPNSLFPLFLTSERPDMILSKLGEGKVITILDQSPSVIVGPISFFEFFTSPDDYYNRWAVGTFLRLLRYFAFFITISLTSLYVSVTTYHYEMIPQNLLASLTESRSHVPFPPIFEALLMEATIELLREAGARLPSKIGQTIGIVGGIVIGTAAVEAGFTSNILIISVAMSAIASFVIPSYTMSGSIRLIRFGLILLSGMLGNFGFAAGISLIIIHMSKLTSLGAPYTIPASPVKPSDWKDIFIRGPFWMLKQRPTQSKTPNRNYNKMKK
ncbi:spore germination protein [Paenibacillus puldeungensis]|uniref:Spore germination protein n=1 Tax=Paenibacillus puldeungensis TaxID=696536 RepID=A0ABW3RTQ0_9BACL